MAAYYIRVGHKNVDAIYDLKSIENGIRYNEEGAFNKKLNNAKIRLVKGVINGAYYENKGEDLVEGQIIAISDLVNSPWLLITVSLSRTL